MTQFVLCLASGDQALREGRYADAEQALTAALALEPRSVKVHFKLGLALEHQRQ
jgi:Flp pilus assembly protein TadD